MEFDVLIEIPKGNRNKYEVDHETGRLRLDRMTLKSPADAEKLPMPLKAALGVAFAADTLDPGGRFTFVNERFQRIGRPSARRLPKWFSAKRNAAREARDTMAS